jgi:hypothetical protein
MRALALRAAKIKVFHVEFGSANGAAMPALAELNLYLQAFQLCFTRERLKAELQSIGIYGCKFADAQTNFDRS